MKNKLFYLMVVVMTTLFAGNSYAQEYATEEAVPWENHAVAIENAANESEGVYLCYRYQEGGETRYGFVTAGADNGTRGILTNRGLRFDVSGSSSSGFKFKSVQRNPNQDDNGSYLGYPSGLFSGDDVYLDQDTQWEVSGNLTNGYQIYVEGGSIFESDHYLTVQNGLLTTSDRGPSGRWFIIPRTEFKEVVLNVERQTNIDVSGLYDNTRFLRNLPAENSWEWVDYTPGTDGQAGTIGETLPEDEYNYNNDYSEDPDQTGELSFGGIVDKGAYRAIDPHIGNGGDYPYGTNSYVSTYGAFGAAEMRDPIIMRQTVSGLKPGTYVITAQAFVSDDNSERPVTDADVAYLFAATGSAGDASLSSGASIPRLSEGEQATFNRFITKHMNEFDEGANDVSLYFRRNVAAGEFLASNGGELTTGQATTSPDETNHIVRIAVTVTADDGTVTEENPEGTGTLTIGVVKASEQGRVYVDNIKVNYSGMNEFGINAYSTKSAAMTSDDLTSLDEFQYGYSRRFNLARDFGETTGNSIAEPKWEALVMPVNLTAGQLRQTFGNDVELCHLVGLQNGGNRIQFDKVDLTNTSETVVYAGECYAVKVVDAPDIARDAPYEFNVYNVDADILDGRIRYTGPVYHFEGVSRMNTLPALIEANNYDGQNTTYEDGVVTKYYRTEDGGGHDLMFKGYFYRNTNGAPANSYVLSNGTVYWLSQPWNRLMGTMWTLQEVDAAGNVVDGNRLSFDFGDGELTGISDITTDGAEGTSMEGVYNLNGQKVSDGDSTDNLPKGIYVVGGRKVVVR